MLMLATSWSQEPTFWCFMPQQLTALQLASSTMQELPIYTCLGILATVTAFPKGFSQVALAAGDEFGFEGPPCPQDTLQTPLHANILSANGHHSCPLPRAAVRTLVFL